MKRKRASDHDNHFWDNFQNHAWRGPQNDHFSNFLFVSVRGGIAKFAQARRNEQKLVSLENPLPSPEMNSLHFRLQFSDKCVYKRPIEVQSVIFVLKLILFVSLEFCSLLRWPSILSRVFLCSAQFNVFCWSEWVAKPSKLEELNMKTNLQLVSYQNLVLLNTIFKFSRVPFFFHMDNIFFVLKGKGVRWKR